MKRYTRGGAFIKKGPALPGVPPEVLCHAPRDPGYRLILGGGGYTIVRSRPKVRMSKKERRRLRAREE